jgi:hypothetical protein
VFSVILFYIFIKIEEIFKTSKLPIKIKDDQFLNNSHDKVHLQNEAGIKYFIRNLENIINQ